MMPHPDRPSTGNILLSALSPDDLALLQPHFTTVAMPRETVLARANAPIEHVYFLEDGLGSIVTARSGPETTEVGIFGRDGVSATCLLLGSDRSPHESFMQVPARSALRIDSDRYLAAVERSATLRSMLLRYVQTLLVQAGQSTAANAHRRVEVRLARWLLMAHDRVEGDELLLTHEFMGMMIAAERSGVTVTLHILEGEGMIRSKRGRVIILDRDKLEELANGSYGVPEAEYRRLIGPLGRASRR